VEVLVAVEVVGTAMAAQHRATALVVASKAVKVKTKMGMMVTMVAEPVVAVVAIWVAQAVLQLVETKVLIQARMVQIWYLRVEAQLQPVLVPQLLYKALGNAIVLHVRDENLVLETQRRILQ
jgi:hypothetical protein